MMQAARPATRNNGFRRMLAPTKLAPFPLEGAAWGEGLALLATGFFQSLQGV